MIKPVYAVPSMADVANVRGSNGYKVVSTFSGAGGACLGFEMAGFDVVWANEFVEAARDTYRENHPGVILDGRDIREVTGDDILSATGLSAGELDVFEGSPPCASFSTAGSREKGWGRVKQYSDTSQRADDLFFEYSRLLGELQPKTFTAENVSGLVKGKAVGYFKEILIDLRSKGYMVEAKVLDASWLGVPQARQRLIFIGVRNDLVDMYGVRPVHPKPMTYRYSCSDVLDIDRTKHRIIHDTSGQFSEGDVTDRPINTVTTANSHWHVAGVVEVTHDPETSHNIRFDRPSLREIKGGNTSLIERRKLTLRELRALSSFPDDFVLTGSYAQRWERIGRSVPPFMARAIAETIKTEILDKIKAREAE